MSEECSPLLDVVGDVSEVARLDAARLELSASSSSSEDSSGGGSSEDAEAEIEKVVVVDPHESARNYDFGLSTITVGRIRQLEALRYFAEGSVHEPGEETVPEPADDEVVFKEFFTAGASDDTASSPHRDSA
jgi:hypothetical protein